MLTIRSTNEGLDLSFLKHGPQNTVLLKFNIIKWTSAGNKCIVSYKKILFVSKTYFPEKVED